MAITVTKAVFTGSRSKGNARLVLLALADHATEEKVRRGDPALAWPSQSTLARECNCSRSTVERALAELADLGEIVDTGERRLRGTVVWEIRLEALEHLTESRSGQDDQTDSGSGEEGGEGDLTHSAHDLTDSGERPDRSWDDLTDSAPRPDLRVGHKPVEPEVEPEEKPEVEQGRASSSTRRDVLPSLSLPTDSNSNGNGKQQQVEAAELEDRRQLLSELEADLERKPDDSITMAALETVRAELADPLVRLGEAVAS